jgi:L-aspartate oxidase
LDISHREADFIKKRFPTIYKRCLSRGIDITKEPIPVVPAAHYMCGGVKVDTEGRTSIPGLFALGETACTGLHGGNRLASNSLLEAVVFADRTAKYCASVWQTIKNYQNKKVDAWESGDARDLQEEILINHNWDAIRRLMWNYVGIVRSTKRLQLAKIRMEAIYKELDQHYHDYHITPNMVELRNIALISLLIIQSAQQRKESRGLHYLIDHKEKSDVIQQTVFRRKRGGDEWEIEVLKEKSNE